MKGTPEGHGAVRRDLHAVEPHDDVVWLQVPCCVCHGADCSHHDTLLLRLHLVRLPVMRHSGIVHATSYNEIGALWWRQNVTSRRRHQVDDHDVQNLNPKV